MSKWVRVNWDNGRQTKELVISENDDIYMFDDVINGNKQAKKSDCIDMNNGELSDNEMFIMLTNLSSLDKFDKSRKQFDYYDLLGFARNYHIIKSM